MKKITKLAALLSCVLLTGCTVQDLKFWEKIDVDKLMFWKKEEEKKPTPVPPTPVEKSIEIAEIPLIPVESELDLSKYVTCSGGSGEFSVSIAESAREFAGIDISGKKIFAEHSGEVPFTVNYSGISKEGKATFAPAEYYKFLEMAENRGYNYAVYDIADDYSFETYYNYAENFYVDLFSGEGYLEEEGEVYSFVFDYDEDDNITVMYSKTGYEPDSIDEISKPFSLKPENLKFEYVPEETYNGRLYDAYESLYVTDEEGLTFLVENIFGYSMRLLELNNFTPTKVEFAELELEDEEGKPYLMYEVYLYVYGELMSGDMGEGVLGYCALDLNDEAFVADDLAEYFATHSVEKANASVQLADIDEALEMNNFEVQYSAGWYKFAKDGSPVALASNPFVTEDNEALGTMIHDYLVCDKTLTAYVTENQTYVENGSAEHSYGLVAKDGNAYFYEGSEHRAELLANVSSIFDEELSKEASNYRFLHTSEGDSLLEEAFINSIDVYENETILSFSSKGVEELFEDLFINAIPKASDIDEEIEDVMQNIAQYNDFYQLGVFLSQQEMIKYLGCEVTIEYAEEAVKSISFDFTWEDELEDSAHTPIAYIMSAKLTNFGSASIPSEVVVSYAE